MATPRNRESTSHRRPTNGGGPKFPGQVVLVFDGQRLRMVGRGDGNNRMLLGGGAWQPLTVTERLGLQRQLARAEFLARTRTLHLNP